MCFHVVYANQWDVERKGERFGKGSANSERTHESGALRKGNSVEVFELYFGLVECGLHYRYDIFLVCAARKLWNHAAKRFVNGLASNDIGTDLVSDKNGRRGVVAGRLNTEYNLGFCCQKIANFVTNMTKVLKIAGLSIAILLEWFFIFVIKFTHLFVSP